MTTTAKDLERAETALPCRCDDPWYAARQLIAPDCPRCHFAEAVADLLAAERERAAQIVKALTTEPLPLPAEIPTTFVLALADRLAAAIRAGDAA